MDIYGWLDWRLLRRSIASQEILLWISINKPCSKFGLLLQVSNAMYAWFTWAEARSACDQAVSLLRAAEYVETLSLLGVSMVQDLWLVPIRQSMLES